jgi:acetoin utilization deacetylase AcuC-like enzyme
MYILKYLRVLYFSIHQYKNGQSAQEANFQFIGDDNGKGFNINVPLTNVRIPV